VPPRAAGIENRAFGHGLTWPRQIWRTAMAMAAITLARAEEYSNLVSV
jgi:hypothetical protein